MTAIQTYYSNLAITSFPPGWYSQNGNWVAKTVSGASDRYTLLSPSAMQIDITDASLELTTQATIDLSLEATWDTIAGTDYRTASNRAGKDFYIYSCQPVSGTVPVVKVSANATTPTNYTASNSRKVGGFHCLCVDVGTISGHTLTGYVAGDVLPQSVWDLNNRAESENEGMVFDPKASAWVDIYLFTGTGTTTTSVNAATIKDTVSQYDFVDYAAAAKKRLLWDHEFTSMATGCKEGMNIAGSADTVTTTGHYAYELLTLDVAPGTAWEVGNTLTGVTSTKTCVIVEILTTLTYIVKNRSGAFTLGEVITNGTYTADQGAANPTFATDTTHGGRMISNIGCEDCAGVLWQWLNDSLTSDDGSTSWAWKDVTGSRGQVYSQGTYGYYKLVAGGDWNDGASCGSRSRLLSLWAWVSTSYIGGRALSSRRS
jgi:hypothetical protein